MSTEREEEAVQKAIIRHERRRDQESLPPPRSRRSDMIPGAIAASVSPPSPPLLASPTLPHSLTRFREMAGGRPTGESLSQQLTASRHRRRGVAGLIRLAFFARDDSRDSHLLPAFRK